MIISFNAYIANTAMIYILRLKDFTIFAISFLIYIYFVFGSSFSSQLYTPGLLKAVKTKLIRGITTIIILSTYPRGPKYTYWPNLYNAYETILRKMNAMIVKGSKCSTSYIQVQ